MNTDELTESQADALDELVHEVASQIASDAINSCDHIDFLKSHGWTDEQIQARVR